MNESNNRFAETIIIYNKPCVSTIFIRKIWIIRQDFSHFFFTPVCSIVTKIINWWPVINVNRALKGRDRMEYDYVLVLFLMNRIYDNAYDICLLWRRLLKRKGVRGELGMFSLTDYKSVFGTQQYNAFRNLQPRNVTDRYSSSDLHFRFPLSLSYPQQQHPPPITFGYDVYTKVSSDLLW